MPARLAALGGLAVTATGAQADTASPTVAYVLDAPGHQVLGIAANGTVSEAAGNRTVTPVRYPPG